MKVAGYIIHPHGRMSFNYPLSNWSEPSHSSLLSGTTSARSAVRVGASDAHRKAHLFPSHCAFCTGGAHRSAYRPLFRSLLTQMVCIHPGPYMNTIKPAE